VVTATNLGLTLLRLRANAETSHRAGRPGGGGCERWGSSEKFLHRMVRS
jgi:hypothetical protein